MLYHWYELSHAAFKPARVAADSCRLFFNNPFNPLTHTAMGRHAVAACEVFERTTRRYDKPAFGLNTTNVDGREVGVREEVVWHKPFCRLLRFKRDIPEARAAQDPRILLVAPMSGHFATLLRGTVETFLPDHEVYITDWQDPRDIPLGAGAFDLDDYIIYLQEMFRHLHGDFHVYAVCQPSVPVLAATALMEEDDDPNVPLSVMLAGGPVDTRVSPTAVNRLAERRGIEWFRNNVITLVPWPNMGVGRAVYPGFLQLGGFMSMNLDRHVKAHKDMFKHLVRGDGDSAEKHREFYDEYLAVMDLTAEFFLQTIQTVFVEHALPRGTMQHRGRRVDLGQIRRVPLMTIEGEKDDITGLGQCRKALELVPNLPAQSKLHYECPKVGHYGIFNGSRFRADIAPRMAQFMRINDPRASRIATMDTIDSRKARERASGKGRDVSSVAFTFAAANDSEQDDSSTALNMKGATNDNAGENLQDTDSHATPFRLWALANRVAIDGLFRLPRPETSLSATLSKLRRAAR